MFCSAQLFKRIVDFTRPTRRAKTRLSACKAAGRSATCRIMSFMSADGRESVSAQCLTASRMLGCTVRL
jgi:hypothetical protein